MSNELYVIGVDYGTDSVRSVLVDTRDGREVQSAVRFYPRWRDGLYCDPATNRFRQHPLDYIETLEQSVKTCVEGVDPAKVVAISVDTTGSTPVAVNDQGVPLALTSGFEENPNAMFVLWKDHTAVREAAELNEHRSKFKTDYLQFVGGIYSSEWFWAKLLHVLREDTFVRQHCYSWVEHCDWIPFLLTGGDHVNRLQRGVCSAGHKALWAEAFGGLPPEEFFVSWDPLLKGFVSRLFTQAVTADRPVGRLSREWSQRLGLLPSVLVGAGAFDAHMGAVGGQIEPYHLSKVMGTSTCDMMVVPPHELQGKLVRGICGQVNGSIIPGMVGLEAGQSAFGDSYAWFREVLAWPLQNLVEQGAIATAQAVEWKGRILNDLTRKAEAIPLHHDLELALDWLNGRRTPDANQELKALVAGLNLATDAPRIFRALVEATCFGARVIVDRFQEEGVPVKGLIGLGGVARKSPFAMQMMADVMNRPIRIHRSDQTCALGAAMFAATVAGVYQKVEDAMAAMGPGFDTTYSPNEANVSIYNERYENFRKLSMLTEQYMRG